MEVSENRGTPSYHPYFEMGFYSINQPAIGYPPWPWKPPYEHQPTFTESWFNIQI